MNVQKSLPLIVVLAIIVTASSARGGERVANPVALTPAAGIAHSVRGVLVGPRVAVFDTNRDSCELIDIPDAPARAFRDWRGVVHLISSHYVMRQSLGPTLESVRHSCQIDYASVHDPNPAHYNDATWLDSFYSLDGIRIVGLGHMEYHGWEHAGMCHSTDDNACWYNADTLHLSVDGGYHYLSFQPPANYIVGLPYHYEIDRGPEGYSIDTNVLKVGPWYYAMVTDWPWPPGCGNPGAPSCLVPFGGSPIRTTNLLDPQSWRGWNGRNFSVSFVDPYLGSVARPWDHIYTPVPYMYYVNAINYYTPAHAFVATLWDPFNTAYGPEGLYLSTSTDLINWRLPTLAVTQAQLLAREPKGNWSYAYFSLLDPQSPDPNFGDLGDHPYLYYVRFDNNHPPYVRVLFRQNISLTAI